MRIILVGFGTVGQSLARILHQDKARLVNEYGFEPVVTTIIDSEGFCTDAGGLNLATALEVKQKHGTVRKYPGQGRRVSDASEIISIEEAEVLVEATPSNFKSGEPGLSHIKEALSTGKHVVTSNKGPLVLAMPALLEFATHKARKLLFSATVGAGTPFLSFASKALPGLKILRIHGILNGTTNYILTQMDEAGISFSTALAEAQAKGYAEANPRNDVEGIDTAAKIVILGNWILKRNLSLQNVQTTGISKVTNKELKQARTSGRRIKLIGDLTESGQSVRPEEVAVNDPICVPGTLNALTVSTERGGDMTLIGLGAGGDQTASAIIRDLVDIRREYWT